MVTSQGQRFRRKALRRGYKVDEVDAFLDRVEAVLAGRPVESPVTAQEVHDVVFRVRFGGYDEWQVDLHLDRVERQLAEMEERGGFGVRGPEPRMAPPMREERMPPPMREERMAPMDRMGPSGSPAGPPAGMPPFRDERMAPPPRDERMAPPARDDRMAPPVPARPVSPMAGPAGPPPMAPPPQPMPAPAGPPPMPAPNIPNFDRYDEPTFAGFEPVRHGRADMTAEMRLGEPGRGAPPGPPAMPGPIPGASGDVQRVDQLRRSFQPRRFGSGYDPGQVDRVFEAIIASMTGRGGPVTEAQLDPAQFNLVSGGYFEAEVEAALREVREILRRR